jgi:hypothetical protein
MRLSPVKPRHWFQALLCVCALSGAAQAYAQALEPPPVPEPQVMEPIAPPVKAPASIQVGTLAAIDPSAIGTLDRNNGGIGPELWAGSDKAMIQALLPFLPANAASPAMNRLARRLLLSRATAAEGPAAAGDSLLALKLKRLFSAGEFEAITSLAGQITNPERDPAAARVVADTFLLTDHLGDAAALADKLARTDSDPFWLKVQALAAQVDGDAARIDLTYGLAREAANDDKPFFALLDHMRKPGKAKLEKIKEPSFLHLVMMRMLKLPLPKDLMQNPEPALIRFLLAGGELDGAARAGLIERLGQMGLAEPRQLAELYGGMTLKDDERARPVDAALKAQGTRVRAILFQGARTSLTTDGQAAALAASYSLNGDPALGALLAEANRGLTVSLPPAPILLPYAGALGRIAALGGDVNAAIHWLDGFRPLARPGSNEATDLAGLAVIIAIADPSAARPLNGPDLDAMIGRANLAPADQRNARIAILGAVLEGLGLTVPPPGNPAISPTVDYATLRAMELAAKAGHVGETAILALSLIGTQGPSLAEPKALQAAITALVQVHLGVEARRIALEALAGHGL